MRARSSVSAWSDDRAQRHRLRLRAVVLRLDARQIEQVLDQRAQALGVAVDDVDEPFADAAGSPASVRRRVSTAERTAVIGVRSSCDTLATKSLRRRLQPPRLADVDEHGEQPLVLAVDHRQRRGVDQQAPRLRPGGLDLAR